MKKPIVSIAAVLGAALMLSACSGDPEPADSPAAGDDATSAAACVPAHTFTTIADGKLTVASPEFPPFSSLIAGSPEGIDTEIARAVAALECLEVEITEVSYAAAVPAVQTGRADLAVGCYYRTKERAEIVDLSDPLYLDGMGVVSKDGVTSIPDIITKKVGSVDGYLWNEDMQKLMDGKMNIYPSNVEMWADLNAGRIEVGFDSVAVSQDKARGTEFQVAVAAPDDRVAASVKAAQIGFPLVKGNAELLAAVNEDIEKLHADGTIKAIFEKYDVDTSLLEVGDAYLIGE
ncbi:MAG: transporter substrate-binding domain-containing protein [Propionibacteriaceae bacterium]|jgi:polar amino acid transport system substrate-binding protein|nr:transporter substrate-binding domain-containing protein [Propionibacteriaceae bacterium]